jgi:hypothetical protein
MPRRGYVWKMDGMQPRGDAWRTKGLGWLGICDAPVEDRSDINGVMHHGNRTGKQAFSVQACPSSSQLSTREREKRESSGVDR